MKKIYLSAMMLAASLLGLQAQITLTQKTHGIVSGDSHYFIFAQGVEEGAAGKNVSWDFSSLKPTDKTLTSHMLTASETPKGGEVTASNVVIEEFGNNFYFADSKTGILDYGVASGNVLTKYEKPALKLKFPLSYGETATGEFSGKQIAGTSEATIAGTYEVTADAYGTLTLPDGVVLKNTLRVKQSRSYNGGASKELVYRWYVSYLHYPVLVITKYADAQGKETATLSAYHPNANAQSKEKSLETIAETPSSTSAYNVYPNPWTDKLSIDYTVEEEQSVRIELFDGNGKLVKVLLSQKQAQGKYTYELTEKVNVGNYFVKIITGSKVVVKKAIKQ